jgi:hypothetical protein
MNFPCRGLTGDDLRLPCPLGSAVPAFPPPLWGRIQVGGIRNAHFAPHPSLPPQKGEGVTAAEGRISIG